MGPRAGQYLAVVVAINRPKKSNNYRGYTDPTRIHGESQKSHFQESQHNIGMIETLLKNLLSDCIARFKLQPDYCQIAERSSK